MLRKSTCHDSTENARADQQIRNDISGFQNRLGIFFFTLALFGFSCLSSLGLFANERILFMRERSILILRRKFVMLTFCAGLTDITRPSRISLPRFGCDFYLQYSIF